MSEISKIKSGKQLAINAMKKELARLKKIADAARAEHDEYINSASVIIGVRNEFVNIVKSKETGKHVVRKLESLQKINNKALSVAEKDFSKILEKLIAAELAVKELAKEIANAEFLMGFELR